MGTRIRSRKSVQHIFEHFIIFEQKWPSIPNEPPTMTFVFPPIADEQEEIQIIQRAQHFAFPTHEKISSIDNFSFVLTNGSGEWTFGYCRQQPGHPTQKCLMMLSPLPYWNTTFYKILNYCIWIANWPDVHETFLSNLYQSSTAEAALEHFAISVQSKPTLPPFVSTCPNTQQLSSTLDNRCLAEFYNSLSVESMITIFASLLSERRIFITSSKLSRLTSIVMACNLLMYPMCWQHVLIPVLPLTLSDYLETPFPFIIGVPEQTWAKEITKRHSRSVLKDVIHVNADTNLISTSFPEDVMDLPNDIISFLKSNLKVVERIGPDGLAKIFLHAFIKLMGHVENSLAIEKNKLTLDNEMFIQLAKSSHRRFIKTKLIQTQMFQQFVDELITNIKCGGRSDDIFSKEVNSVTSTSSSGSGSGNKSATFKRIKADAKSSPSRLHGSLSVTNISNPMPITPDLIRFNDTSLPSSIMTLPRTRSDHKDAEFSTIVSKPTTTSASSLAGYRHTIHPAWANSWKHVVNDFQVHKLWSPTNGISAAASPKPRAISSGHSGTSSSSGSSSSTNIFTSSIASPWTPTPSTFIPSPPVPPLKSPRINVPTKKQTEDLIQFDAEGKKNMTTTNKGNSTQGSTDFDAYVQNYAELLKEYGLYKFYTNNNQDV